MTTDPSESGFVIPTDSAPNVLIDCTATIDLSKECDALIERWSTAPPRAI